MQPTSNLDDHIAFGYPVRWSMMEQVSDMDAPA
jgi:hypothetical protein